MNRSSSIRATTPFAAIGVALAASSVAFAQDDAAAVSRLTALFAEDVIVGEPTVVDCTLSGGTRTTCLSVTVRSNLTEDEMGPWCPGSITDGPEAGGILVRDGEVHDVDGPFVENLDTFYDDPEWQLYDPATGEVRVTDTKESCELAARPDVDPEYNNYCVQCQSAYLDEEVHQTFVLPLSPVVAETPSDGIGFSGVGVAFNGVKFDAPAPAGAILAAHTLAPFDDCGGHVNPHVGYHYHAAGGCSPEVEGEAAHAALIGLAMDGYPLAARLNLDGSAPDDLDACLGHQTDDLGYHYHANEMGSNQTIGCHTGETGCTLSDGETSCDATAQRRGPGAPREGDDERG